MRAAGLLILLLARVQEPGHEDVIKQSLELLGKISMSLGEIKDAESAEKARPELAKLAAEWTAWQKKARSLPPPEPAEKERLTKTYKKDLAAAEKKLRGELIRLESIPGSRPAVREITGVLTRPEQ
jgi:hypothetical protein